MTTTHSSYTRELEVKPMTVCNDWPKRRTIEPSLHQSEYNMSIAINEAGDLIGPSQLCYDNEAEERQSFKCKR